MSTKSACTTVTGEERIIGPGFRAHVYAVVKTIAKGTVTTYGDVAGALGSRRIARQVGFALAALDDDDLPWHRVINAQGRISFKGDLARASTQRTRLETEGIRFDVTERVIDFEKHKAKLRAPESPARGAPSRGVVAAASAEHSSLMRER